MTKLAQGHARPAFEARRRRSDGARRARADVRAARKRSRARIAAANTAAEAFAHAAAEGIALGDAVARAALADACKRRRRHRHRDRGRVVRPRRPAGRRRAPIAGSWRALRRGTGGDSRDHRARCRGNSPPPARVRPAPARCARSVRRRFGGDVAQACRARPARPARSRARRRRPGSRRRRCGVSSPTMASMRVIAEMDRKRRAGCREGREPFARAALPRRARHAREHHALRDLRHRQFAAERRRGGGESRHARRQRKAGCHAARGDASCSASALNRSTDRRNEAAPRRGRPHAPRRTRPRWRRAPAARCRRCARRAGRKPTTRAARWSRHKGRPGSGR